MTPLLRLLRKKTRKIVGLMSGTSVDSVDAVLLRVVGSGTATKFSQLAFVSLPYPKGFREFVLGNSQPGRGSVDTLSTLNILIAHFFADAVKALAKKARIPLSRIDLVGSHGQTVHHLPHPRRLFGKDIRSSLQIGDPSTIAKLTGIITVGDFRVGDMAVGGQGAPLVPYFDYIAFHSRKHHRLLLNIGGIANITLLRKNCTIDEVVAFDTGPGNMVVDGLMKKLYGVEFDKSGMIAFSGRILPEVISKLLTHSYFSRRPPKSTGREMFGEKFVQEVLRVSRGARRQDVIATVTEFTALTVFQQCRRFFGIRVDEIIVSGGGSRNRFMIEVLKRYFHPAPVLTSDDAGVSSAAKEAICFAILANETIESRASNIPTVTGASMPTVLGKICL